MVSRLLMKLHMCVLCWGRGGTQLHVVTNKTFARANGQADISCQ